MEQGRREMKPPPQQPPPPPPENHPPPENQPPNHPPPPPRNCPRCDSGNTKFCYYNNYSLSQPRYFCKSCRRYWTQGGTLRNVPVGGGCRKAKRAKTSSSSNSGNVPMPTPPPVVAAPNYYSGGGFLSSLATMNSYSQPHINSPFGSSPSGFSLFQGYTLPPPSSQLPPQSQTQTTDFYPMTNPSLDQPNRPLGFWNQTLIHNNNNMASKPNPSTIVGTSLNPNPFPDFPGYDPSSS